MVPSLITNCLNSMTREELRAVAKELNIKSGKDKNTTIANLVTAFGNLESQFTIQFTIRKNPENPEWNTVGNAIYSKKLRTHKHDRIMLPILQESQVPA
jgi:hypothetical protein